MNDPVYRSQVRIISEQPGIKHSYVDPFPQPIRSGVHSDLKAWYKAQVTEDLPSPLDYLVSVIASWLTGTLGGAGSASDPSLRGHVGNSGGGSYKSGRH
jgi:hypothetical protein